MKNTIEHIKNRISILENRDPSMNANIIRKLKRQLKKLSGE